jgi:acetolactate synthase regulatory subunit
MQNLTPKNSQLEQDLIALHTGTTQSKEWFHQSVMNILKAPTQSSFAKADSIAEAFTSLDAKIDYIKEQQRVLATLKKQLELAKSLAKTEVSNALISLGVTKLEGLAISSITATKATDKSVAKLEILNEDELLNRGFFKVEVDTEAVEKALLSADQRHEVEEFADMKIELVHKPATIRINKRKVVAQDEPISIAA